MVCVGRGCSVVGVIAVALMSGCAPVDLAGDQATGSDTDTGQAGTATAGDDDGPGETSGASTDSGPNDPTGADSDTDTGDEGGTSGGEDVDTAAACDELECSGAGTCEEGDDGPFCSCVEGWASIGLDCIPCDTVAGSMLPAFVPTVEASFRFLVDGDTPPQSIYQNSRLSLRNRASGDMVILGETLVGQSSLLMVPGVYEVLYQHLEGSVLPKNKGAVVDQLEVNDNVGSIEINIKTATLRGSIGFEDGDEPDSEGYNYGRLWLVNPRTGDRVRLADSFEDTYDVSVIPGLYELHYQVQQSQGQAPLNREGRLRELVIGSGTNTHDIVVPVARYRGDILIDGDTVTSIYDNGDLEIVDTVTGDRFPIAGTEDGSFDVPLLPGSYEVVYTSIERGELSPRNKGAIVDSFQLEDDDLRRDLEMVTAVLSGEFRVNGLTPPTDTFDDGIVTLESAALGSATIGLTSEGTYSTRVLAGTYDVFYGQETAGVSMPVNTHALLPAQVSTGDGGATINIPVAEIVGNLTIGGSQAPDSPYDDGRLYLRNAATGDEALLGNTRVGTYAARVVPGTYDLLYRVELSEGVLPVNGGAILRSGVEVGGNTPIDIDVPVSTLEGSVEIQGTTPSIDEGLGNLFLRDVVSGDEVFIGHTGATQFTKPLTDGTYVMEYRGVPAAGATLGASLPANENAAFACFELVSE